MAGRSERSPHRTWVGILLVIIGFLFLMDTLDVLRFGHVFSDWWPLILVVVGFLKLRGRDKPGGMVLFIVGLVFLSATLNIVNWGSIFRFWPLILIAAGASMLLKARGKTVWGIGKSEVTSEEFVRGSAIFGRGHQTVTSKNLRGGDVMALFGGVELDLRGAGISPDGCDLSLTALFGGVEVIVPQGWKVSVSGTPIVGGIDDNTTRAGGEVNGGTLYCRCTVAFGGVEIKN